MIIFSNNKIAPDTIINKYPLNSPERQIVTQMAFSNEVYQYSYLNQLNFELKFRINIIDCAKEMYKSDISFKTFEKSTCNSDYWTRTEVGGFLLKEGIKSSEGIKDIYENGDKYGTECSTALTIIYYKALLNILPIGLFNDIFPKLHLLNWHYIDPILSDISFLHKKKDYLPGDRRYYKNPDASPLKPEWSGENVIDLGDGTYFGHGIGIKIESQIIYVLNKHRKENATVSAYLLDTVARPDFKYIANLYYNNLII